MSPRQYKKNAKRAREVLISSYGFSPKWFWTPPASERGEHEIETSEIVTGSECGSISIPRGCPTYLPVFTDYWGEALAPNCCISILREYIWWEIAGKAASRKMTQAFLS